jgi:hypothetical protein
MNWTKIYHSIPDRVRLGVGGIVVAILFVTGPSLLAGWIRYWS